MTSPRRSRDRPIETASLVIRFGVNGKSALRILECFPSASIRGGVCEVKVVGSDLQEVTRRTGALLAALRGVGTPPPGPRKALSRERGRRAEN